MEYNNHKKTAYLQSSSKSAALTNEVYKIVNNLFVIRLDASPIKGNTICTMLTNKIEPAPIIVKFEAADPLTFSDEFLLTKR